jgi:Spy/CpxP family protein refolding chaperone
MRAAALSLLLAVASLDGRALAEPNPYATVAGRGVKGLSKAEIGDLLAGRGAGMALPAELNRYPGPKHVLELAGRLGLTPAQEAETRRLFERMQSEAVPLGEALVDKEVALDRLFASGAADEAALRTLVSEAARLRGELRVTHLKYHLAMRRLLSPAQVAAYDAARGYGAGEPHEHRGRAHHP